MMYIASTLPWGLVLVLAFTLVAQPREARAEWAEWIVDAGLSTDYHENINRSSFSADEKDDTVFRPSLSLGRYNQLTDSTRLRVTVDLEAGVNRRYEDLGYNRAGITLSVRQKLGFGIDAPWLRPYVSASYLDARDDLRDSRMYEAGVHLGKHLTDRLDASVGYSHESRDARSGTPSLPSLGSDVFDQEVDALSAEAAYRLAGDLRLTAGYAYRYGDFDSSCTAANFATVLAVEDVKAMVGEEAYDEPLCVYRLVGRMDTVSLDASYALFAGHGSLNLGYRRHDGEADTLDYQSSVLSISFMYSY